VAETSKIAADKMQQAIEGIKAAFIDELSERCDDIESELMALEVSMDGLAELCRQVHSLKGTSAMYALPFVSVICHQIEDMMQIF